MHAVSVNGALGKIELRTAQAGPEFVQIMAVISDYVTQIVYRNTVGILSNIPLPGPRARKRRHHQLARRHAVASLE